MNNGYPKGSQNKTGGPDNRPTWARGMQEAWEWCEKHITPVDCYGEAGTVVFYHNKLAHMAGQNYSNNIRQAVLCGFALSEEALPEAELMAHAIDCDIWRDWSTDVRHNTDCVRHRSGSARATIDVCDDGVATQTIWYARGKL